jgi:hypothetical protein
MSQQSTHLIATEDEADPVICWAWTNAYGGRSLIEWDVTGTFDPAPAIRTASRNDGDRTLVKPAAARRIVSASEDRSIAVPREDRGL